MATQIKVVSGATDEAHPELFDIRAMPPQPKEKKPGQLPEESIRKFFEDVSTKLACQFKVLRRFTPVF